MRKKRKQSATTWSAEEKKSIAAVKGLSANEWHQVDYAQTVARIANRKAAQARMDERIKTALRFL